MARSFYDAAELEVVARVPLAEDDIRPVYDVTCPTCGKAFCLWFNGGELDSKECCGVEYELRATGFELVTSKIRKSV